MAARGTTAARSDPASARLDRASPAQNWTESPDAAPCVGAFSLFLAGLVLFVMTFCVNTIAEVVRQRLRERYRAI